MGKRGQCLGTIITTLTEKISEKLKIFNQSTNDMVQDTNNIKNIKKQIFISYKIFIQSCINLNPIDEYIWIDICIDIIFRYL